eukprot:gene12638-16946_t
MSVLISTSAGELVVDLFTELCPLATKNFLKLCKMKYYHGCLFYNKQTNYIIQSGDPTATGKGGKSIFGGYFQDELNKGLKLNKIGMICMVGNNKENSNLSQFFITLRGDDMEHLEKNHTVFGEVAEGLDVLEKLNNLFCDEEGRPYQDVRIKHTYILDDPFNDPNDFVEPSSSPLHERPTEERLKPRIPYEDDILHDSTTKDGRTEEEIEAEIKRKEAHSRAIVLEMTGDLPDAEVKPPDEVLFVCKLNPVTTDEDLEIIFSRFGKIKSCEIIRDHKTGDSLNYAFIEFETEQSCIEAYEKMNNVLIDDRRIKVDFSQSVSKLWNRFLLKPRTDKKPIAPSIQGKSDNKNNNLSNQQVKPSNNHDGNNGRNNFNHNNRHNNRNSPPKDKNRFDNNNNNFKKRYRDDSRERDHRSSKDSNRRDSRDRDKLRYNDRSDSVRNNNRRYEDEINPDRKEHIRHRDDRHH